MNGLQPGTKGFLIAVAYGVSSASMAFANKAVLNTYNFDYPVFLVTIQMVFSVVLLELLSIFNVELTPISWQKCKELFFPSLFYTVNAVMGLSALSGMNIPMYGMVKRCTPLVVLILGTVILGKGQPGALICVSVGMITLGFVVAGYGDLAFDIEAYMFGFGSVVSQALYQVLIQKRAATLSATDTLHLNSYNTLPILLTLALVTGELKDALLNFQYLNLGFLLTFTLVISMGCVLNYLLFLCIMFNSALTTSVTGVLKSVIQTLIGVFTFGGINLNVFTVSGMIINLLGGTVYSFVKYMDNRRKAIAKTKSVAKELVKIVDIDSNPSSRMEQMNGVIPSNQGNSYHVESVTKVTRLHRISACEEENGESKNLFEESKISIHER